MSEENDRGIDDEDQEPAFNIDPSLNFDASNPEYSRDHSRVRGTKRGLVIIGSVVAIIALILAAFLGTKALVFDRSQSGTSQSGDTSESGDASQSGVVTKEEKQAIADEEPEAFREAITDERIEEAESQYDMDWLNKQDDSVNPMKTSVYGVYAYNVSVPQEWKDSYGDQWQTMIPSVLHNLSRLWGDDNFHGKAFDADQTVLEQRIQSIYDVSDSDEFVNRLAPLSGVAWTDNEAGTKTEATEDDYSYYNALVPVLDADGKVPGTDYAPTSMDWNVDVIGIKVLGNDYTGTGVYAEYPRIQITRQVSYDGGAHVATQDLTFFVNNVNGEWKLVQVEYGSVSVS